MRIIETVMATAVALMATTTLVAPPEALAQSVDLKTGLWEETIKSEQPPGPAVDPSMMDGMMAGMTPEQRANVEKVLKRQAAERQAQGNRPVVTSKTKRFCMTQEMLKDDWAFDRGPDRGDRDRTCSQKFVERSAHRMHVKMQCSGELNKPGRDEKDAPAGEIHSTTEIIMDIKSRESFSGSVTSDMTYGGQHRHSQSNAEAHWLGVDCDKVK